MSNLHEWEFLSMILCYIQAGSLYSYFLQRGRLRSSKLLSQGFWKE